MALLRTTKHFYSVCMRNVILCTAIGPTRCFATTEEDIDRTVDMLAKDLCRLGIDYVIIGGNALKIHGFWRFTSDVDVLLEKGGKKLFADGLIGRGYVQRFTNARSKFKSTIYNIPIDLLEAGDYPGDGKPKNIAFPDPCKHSFEAVNSYGNTVKYLELSAVIELKLASYQNLPNQRLKDKFDVVELIKVAKLSEEFSAKLDCTVRDTFHQCYLQALEDVKAEN